MALNAKRPNSRTGRGNNRGSRYNGDTIVAAAEKLVDRIEKSGAAGHLGEPWQREAWNMFRAVPEFRAAARITGQAMSQCRLVIARVSPDGGEPAPLDLRLDDKGNPVSPADYDHPAQKWLAGFAGGQGGQQEMLDQLGVYFTVSGESILVGALDPDAARVQADPFLRMQAYSEQQIRVRSKLIVVRTDESGQSDRVIERGEKDDLGPKGETAVRIWRPDPELNWRADAVAKSALPVLREITLMDSHIRASAISRLVTAGLLLVPEGMNLPGKAEEDADPDDQMDPFMLLLMDMFSLAIKDPDSAAAMVPILLRGDKEDLEALRLLTMSTPFDEKVSELRKDAIGRLGVSVDMPAEILTGYGALQHWTGALVTDEWKNGYLSTLMALACNSITTGALYPYLAKTNPELPADVIIWFDDSSVRTRENTGPEAQGAYDRGEIGGDTYRRALGFDESDAPTGEELTLQLAKTLLLKAPALAPLLLPVLGIEVSEKALEAAARIASVIGTSAGAPPGGSGDIGGLPAEGGTVQEPMPGAVPGDVAAALDLMLRR